MEFESWVFMEKQGMSDRIMGAPRLGRDIGLWIEITRKTGTPDFGQDEKRMLTRALELLVPAGRNLALSYGLATGAQPLTEREQGTLRCMLSGLSEQEIADSLEISRHTAHD
jgi:ATP/maltotriose-dependent transcriptional regulator MalT